MNKDIVWQLVRAGINMSGAGTFVWGYISEETLQALVGALVVLVMVSWEVYVRWGTKAVPVAVVEARALPTVSPVTGAVEHPLGAP